MVQHTYILITPTFRTNHINLLFLFFYIFTQPTDYKMLERWDH